MHRVALVAALFLIFALIAIPLHSYSQPLIIMSVIPFGAIGAVVGHIIMDHPISMFSMFGLVALAEPLHGLPPPLGRIQSIRKPACPSQPIDG